MCAWAPHAGNAHRKSDGHTQPGAAHALAGVCAHFIQDASPNVAYRAFRDMIVEVHMARGHMLMLFGTVLLGTHLVMGAGIDAHAADESAPACKRAEVNPVTGHVFCIDPLGADVAPPPDSVKPDCVEQSRGQWTWAPTCEPLVDGS